MIRKFTSAHRHADGKTFANVTTARADYTSTSAPGTSCPPEQRMKLCDDSETFTSRMISSVVPGIIDSGCRWAGSWYCRYELGTPATWIYYLRREIRMERSAPILIITKNYQKLTE